MDGYADRPVHNLSFGQKKRVCIAGVLAMEPELLILDEPMAGLDHAMRTELLSVLDGLHARGITLLMATHDIDLAYRWADHIHVMIAGRCSASLPGHELETRHAALTEAGIAPLHDDPATIDDAHWVAAYSRVLTPEHLQRRFSFPNPGVAARLAALARHLAARHLWAIRQPGAAANPYVTTVFAGDYAIAAGEPGLPRYLQHNGQAALRALGIAARLALHQGNLLDLMPQLAARGGAYDLISLSNIADWMDEPQVRSLVQASCACLRPGGALLIRAANPEALIRPAVAAAMDVDPALDARLPAIERGPWFRTVVAGFRQVTIR